MPTIFEQMEAERLGQLTTDDPAAAAPPAAPPEPSPREVAEPMAAAAGGVWLDYSAGAIPGAILVTSTAYGQPIRGVIRYVDAPGTTNPKCITAAEYADLRAHNLGVLLVFEHQTTDALSGHASGAANARLALAGADALGYTGPIFMASDMHLNDPAHPEYLPAALAYLDGAADVLGLMRTGAYGFPELMAAVAGGGHAAALWQCGSAPAATNPNTVHFWQVNNTTSPVLGGISCDINIPLATMAGLPGMDAVAPADIAAIWNYPLWDYVAQTQGKAGATLPAAIASALTLQRAAEAKAAAQAAQAAAVAAQNNTAEVLALLRVIQTQLAGKA